MAFLAINNPLDDQTETTGQTTTNPTLGGGGSATDVGDTSAQAQPFGQLKNYLNTAQQPVGALPNQPPPRTDFGKGTPEPPQSWNQPNDPTMPGVHIGFEPWQEDPVGYKNFQEWNKNNPTPAQQWNPPPNTIADTLKRNLPQTPIQQPQPVTPKQFMSPRTPITGNLKNPGYYTPFPAPLKRAPGIGQPIQRAPVQPGPIWGGNPPGIGLPIQRAPVQPGPIWGGNPPGIGLPIQRAPVQLLNRLPVQPSGPIWGSPSVAYPQPQQSYAPSGDRFLDSVRQQSDQQNAQRQAAIDYTNSHQQETADRNAMFLQSVRDQSAQQNAVRQKSLDDYYAANPDKLKYKLANEKLYGPNVW